MYIPDFWCGVFVTVLIEIIGLIGIAFWQEGKKKK